MNIEGTKLSVPGADDDAPDEVFELRDVFAAEARQGEVAIVTPVKAPELLALFNQAWSACDKLAKKLTSLGDKAEQALGRVRAHMLLNEVEAIIKEKGVPSTKETRDAVIVLDPRWIIAQDRVDQVRAAAEWMKGKQKSFENSFTSVKKIMGEDAYNMSTRMNNPNLSGAGKTYGAPAQNPKPTPASTQPSSGYGKSRYDR